MHIIARNLNCLPQTSQVDLLVIVRKKRRRVMKEKKTEEARQWFPSD